MASEEDKKEITELKEKLDELSKKLEIPAKTTDNQDINIKKELQDLKNKYIFLLENMVRLASQGQRNIPTELSNQSVADESKVSTLGDVQVLMLLKQSKATSKEFAATASQLKKAFNINKSERTIRNKLNYLEMHNLVISFGKKPKLYYMTPSGISIIEKHNKTAIFPTK